MKKSLLISLLVAVFAIPVFADQIVVIELTGQKKTDIYQKSLQWISYKFNSGKAVIDYQSPDMGRIIGKGFVVMGNFVLDTIYLHETVTIDCVNGKARIQLASNNKCRMENGQRVRDCTCETFYIGPYAKDIDKTELRLIDEYRQYMTTGGEAAWDGK